MFIRLITNCNCRFLKFNMDSKTNKIDPKIRHKINGSFLLIMTKPISDLIIGNHKYSPPIIKAEINKYTVCILCNIYFF